jgi:hypothetical protein
LVAAGRRGDAVEIFMTQVGMPAQMIAQMRQSPAWPGMEASAQSMVYDATIAQDVEQGDPAAPGKWASVAVPTLVMDGTLFLGRAEGHAFMRNGADALAKVLPHAERRTLDGQDQNWVMQMGLRSTWKRRVRGSSAEGSETAARP